MIPHIQYKGKTIVFMADLLATAGHIPSLRNGIRYRPLLTMPEKLNSWMLLQTMIIICS
jgi:hypothetical protein